VKTPSKNAVGLDGDNMEGLYFYISKMVPKAVKSIMAFMLFKKDVGDDGMHYANAHQHYKLAGDNLLYRL